MSLEEQVKKYKDKKALKFIFVVAASIVLLYAIYFSVKWYGDSRAESELILRTKSEMEIKQLKKEAEELILGMANKKKEIDSLKLVAEIQDNNPKIIIKKNADIHINIDNLDAVNSIVLFTNNLSEYSNNRDRYSLVRFENK